MLKYLYISKSHYRNTYTHIYTQSGKAEQGYPAIW